MRGDTEGTVEVLQSRKPTVAEGRYHWVYLWHLPIRITHWFAAGSIVLLVVTGYYIGQPYVTTGGEASSHFVMGWMRFLHFTGAGILVACAILRVYWLFVGNKYERWQALFPIQRKDWVNTMRMMKAYTTVRFEDAPHYIGHNPLQQMGYTMLYLMGILAIVTGFGLYGLADTGGFFFGVFGWVGPALGGWPVVRLVHHALMWIFIAFVPLHVYLVVRSAVLDRAGELSSIFTGGRFIREGVVFEDE